jgi:thiol:disulfide interchange protein
MRFLEHYPRQHSVRNLHKTMLLGPAMNVPPPLVIWLLLLSWPFLTGSSSAAATQELSAEVILSKKAFAPRETVVVALHVVIPDNYHLYANPLGPGIGKPVTIRARASKGITWLDLYKSPPEKFTPEMGSWVWAYEKETFFFLKGVLSESPVPVVRSWISLQGLVCHASCIPVKKAVDFEIRTDGDGKGPAFEADPSLRSYGARCELMTFSIVNDTVRASAEPVDSLFGRISLTQKPAAAHQEPPATWDYEPVERKVSMNLLLAILFGFVAGIILNVMPCVLPVLGLKILSLAQTGGSSRRSALSRSVIFSCGMISVFMMLAALASFAHLSWGQHFQSPWFLIALILVTVVFSLGMFDIYILPIPTNISDLEKKSGRGAVGDFLRGMLATLLATPCSGPFLGATLAWTLTQSTLVIFLVFGSIGLGMAFPYVLLSSNRTLLRLMPKPGRWMNDFKHLMGFLLLGASVYLLFGLPKDMVAATVCFCLVAAFSIVLYSRLAPFNSSLSRKVSVACAAGLVLAAGGYFSFDALHSAKTSGTFQQELRPDVQWEDFSPQLLKGAHAEGRHVVVDFTANWCLNCQYNLVRVLNADDVKALLQKKEVLALKADLTWANPPAESLMHSLGSRSVPFLAVFRGDDPYHPVIMRDILNKGDFIRVLKSLPEK